MVVITAFAILLSITYDRKELAVLAIIGGFGSPFMLSTGEGNYIVLFSYILILNVGMLMLAYFKKWNIINIISFAFTILIYGGWLATKVYHQKDAPLMGAFIFASIFYVVFFLMNIINNIKENKKFIAADISILVSNTFLYYSAGSIILSSVQDGMYKGLFTLLIAVFNFAFAIALYKNKKADSNFVYLLIGLVLTFISLAAPVQLKGNQITLFWSAETVLLLWLSQKSTIKLFKVASLAVMVLSLISLVMDWANVYSVSEPLTILLNKGYLTSLVALASVILTILLLKKEQDLFLYSFAKKDYQFILSGVFVVLLYVSQLLELRHQLNTYILSSNFREVIVGSYNLLFLAVGSFILSRRQQTYRIISACVGVAGILIFISYYHIKIINLRYDYLVYHNASLSNFCYHIILVALAAIILFITTRTVSALAGFKSAIGKTYLWYLAFAIVFISSAELDHIIVLSNYTNEESLYSILSQNHKIGYPILWGICSFIFMAIGMRNKIKDLRIISLCLFSLTLLKLFIIDIRGISEGGKIAAFICLGILLLIISFMYQKLKKLFVEEEVKSEIN